MSLVNLLNRYALKEALPIFFFSLLLIAGLSILTNILPVMQWLGGASIGGIIKFVLLQLPWALTMTFPTAILLASMLGFGRLSRESELIAIQAGGIRVGQISKLLLALGLALTIISIILYQWFIPWTNKAKILLYWNELVGNNQAVTRMAGKEIAVGNYRLRFEGYESNSNVIKDVRLESWENHIQTVVLAKTADFQEKKLTFHDYKIIKLDFDQLPVANLYTFAQTQSYLQKLVKAQIVGKPGQNLIVTLSQSREDLEAEYAGGFENFEPLSFWWNKTQDPVLAPREKLQARAQLHSTLAVAASSLFVLFLTIPLAKKSKSGMSSALGLGLLLTLGYYILFAIGKGLALSGSIPPELAAWSPNLIAVAVGLWLGRDVYFG